MIKAATRWLLWLSVITAGLAGDRASAATVLTLAGGLVGTQAVAVDVRVQDEALQRNVFFADSRAGSILELVSVNGILPANPAILTVVPPNSFAVPAALAIDGSGNLFVTDTLQQQAFEVTAASGYATIRPLAGTFNNPTGIAVDRNGNVFVADGSNNLIFELTAANAYGTVVPVSGPWLSPTAVAVDPNGNVFVADAGDFTNGAVWEALAVGGILSGSPAVNQLAPSFPLGPLQGVVVDPAGNVFVSNLAGPEIDEIPAAGGYATGLVVTRSVASPANLGVDDFGNVYIADQGNATIEEIQLVIPPPVPTLGATGLLLLAVLLAGAAYRRMRRSKGMMGATGRALLLFGMVLMGAAERAQAAPLLTLASGLTFPDAIALDSKGDVFVADATQIKEIAAVGGTVPANSSAVRVIAFDGSFPGALAFDAADNLFVVAGPQIVEFTAASAYQTMNAIAPSNVFGTLFGIALDATGNLYVCDGSQIDELTVASGYTTVTTLTPASGAAALAVDPAGDIFYVTLSGLVFEVLAVNGAIPASPTITQLAPSAQLASTGIALDTAGNVFVSNGTANAVDEIPAAGGYANAVAVTTTGLNNPNGVAVDRLGNVYVADSGNQAVEEIQLDAPPPAPALGQWGLILFALLLAGAASGRVRRRSA